MVSQWEEQQGSNSQKFFILLIYEFVEFNSKLLLFSDFRLTDIPESNETDFGKMDSASRACNAKTYADE